MPLNSTLLAAEISAEIRKQFPASSLSDDVDGLARAVATAVVRHLQTNAVPVVGGSAGRLT